MFDHSDTGNGELINHLCGDFTRYDVFTDRWLQWQNKHRWYELLDYQRFGLAVKAANQRLESSKTIIDVAKARSEASWGITSRNIRNIENALTAAKNLPPIGAHEIRWDSQPNLLAVANGVVNLAEGTIRPGQRNDFITRGISIPFLENQECPLWEKFLADITCGDQELQDFLQRAIGYTLTGFVRDQVFFILYGHGSNGKSVLINIIGRLLEGFSSTVRFAAFEENTNSDAKRDIAELPGVRAAFSSEGSPLKALDTAVIKKITGGEYIKTSRKYGHPIEFFPQFKLWLTTNHLPKIEDDAFGFWRRPILVPFNATFEGKSKDPRMEERLTEELPGILAWAIKGAAIWSKIGISTPDKLLQQVYDYRDSQDDCENFIKEALDKDSSSSMRASELYGLYQTWCNQTGVNPKTNTAFGKVMSGDKTTPGKLDYGLDSAGKYYKGVRMRINVRI